MTMFVILALLLPNALGYQFVTQSCADRLTFVSVGEACYYSCFVGDLPPNGDIVIYKKHIAHTLSEKILLQHEYMIYNSKTGFDYAVEATGRYSRAELTSNKVNITLKDIHVADSGAYSCRVQINETPQQDPSFSSEVLVKGTDIVMEFGDKNTAMYYQDGAEVKMSIKTFGLLELRIDIDGLLLVYPKVTIYQLDNQSTGGLMWNDVTTSFTLASPKTDSYIPTEAVPKQSVYFELYENNQLPAAIGDVIKLRGEFKYFGDDHQVEITIEIIEEEPVQEPWKPDDPGNVGFVNSPAVVLLSASNIFLLSLRFYSVH